MKQGGALLFGLLAVLAMTPGVQSIPVAEVFDTYYGVAVQGSEDSERDFIGQNDFLGCGMVMSYHEVELTLDAGGSQDELVLTALTYNLDEWRYENVQATARLGEPATLKVATWQCFPEWTVSGATVEHAATYRVNLTYLG